MLPRDPALAERVAARLKLSNKASKRLADAADPSLGANPAPLAYRLGTRARSTACCSRPARRRRRHRRLAPPRLPIGGGDLIARGVPKGPRWRAR